MKIKNTIQKELIGKIINLHKDLGIVESNSNKFNFDIKSCISKVNLNDDVIFLVKNENSATAIRKLYTNTHAVKFSSRVMQGHIHIDLDNYLPSLIENISNSDEDYIEIEHEYPYVIGKSECVRTNESDTIIYAIRKGRKGYSRFVLNRESEDCKSVFAAFKKIGDSYSIMTIFIGKKAGREPWDPNATASDKIFWDNHALIFNEKNIQEDTIRESLGKENT